VFAQRFGFKRRFLASSKANDFVIAQQAQNQKSVGNNLSSLWFSCHIEEAIKNNELEIRGFQSHYAELEEEWNANLTGDFNAKCMEYARRSKTYHARRIAFFVVKGWDGDPIVLEPDAVAINDGLHRLKAAKHMDLQEVEIKIAGENWWERVPLFL